jgi:hypothetical protein
MSRALPDVPVYSTPSFSETTLRTRKAGEKSHMGDNIKMEYKEIGIRDNAVGLATGYRLDD